MLIIHRIPVRICIKIYVSASCFKYIWAYIQVCMPCVRMCVISIYIYVYICTCIYYLSLYIYIYICNCISIWIPHDTILLPS